MVYTSPLAIRTVTVRGEKSYVEGVYGVNAKEVA
jgi:hypothetical protein